MKSYEPYYDSISDTWRVIAKDNDGHYFNVIPDAGDEENAKETAHALNKMREN